MRTGHRVLLGCLLTPVVLIASCIGRVQFDAWMYQLPGEVLKSPEPPTKTLDSSFAVAEALDSYVQPRFEILRDKNFGALRIVYRKHAGIVQLKVDTPEEKAIIANVNATGRDYAICLLHCAPRPSYSGTTSSRYVQSPKLQMLYLNQQPIASDADYASGFSYVNPKEAARKKSFDLQATQEKAVDALPKLRKGQEYRTEDANWDVLMRPVTAFDKACLNCHTDAQSGATLGVMVYAVRKVARMTAQGK